MRRSTINMSKCSNQNGGLVRTFLEVAPSFHRDLTAIEFAFVLDPSLLCLLARRLPGVPPTEVIELPVSV